MQLTGQEFLRRFSQHIFPKGFVRIRRFGIYHHTTKRNLDLQFVQDEKPSLESLEKSAETSAERIHRLTGFDPGLCPSGKKVSFQCSSLFFRLQICNAETTQNRPKVYSYGYEFSSTPIR